MLTLSNMKLTANNMNYDIEVIARFGGWWVDADGVSVRSLRDLTQDAPPYNVTA